LADSTDGKDSKDRVTEGFLSGCSIEIITRNEERQSWFFNQKGVSSMPGKSQNASPTAAFPTAEGLRNAPVFHFRYYVAKDGQEQQLLNALVQAAQTAAQGDNVMHVNVYQLVHGNGPTYLLILKARNPAALDQLSRRDDLRSLVAQIEGFAKLAKHDNVSQAAHGKLGT
jgi:hypothetical protein